MTTTLRRCTVAVLTAALALVSAGCSRSDDDASGPVATLGDTVELEKLMDDSFARHHTSVWNAQAVTTEEGKKTTTQGKLELDLRDGKDDLVVESSGGAGGPSRMVRVGDRVFLKMAGAPKYQETPADPDPTAGGVTKGIASGTLKYLRSEQRDGQEMRVYEGQDILAAGTAESTSGHGTVWVDRNGDVRRMELKDIKTADGRPGEATYTLGWGEDLKIQAPADSEVNKS